MKKFLTISIKSIFILFIIFILVEIVFLIVKPNYLILDAELGWKLKPNYKLKKKETDLYGQTYNVKFQFNNKGIITVGKDKDTSISILVLGDSFSSDPYVSKDKMWYGILHNELEKKLKKNIQINVLAAGGYGNLQQYLLMKKMNLESDLIILQFCDNDFENNLLEIEKKTGSMNQYARRPYLSIKDGIYFDDSFVSKLLRTKFIGESRIFNKLIFWYGYKKKNNIIDKKLKDNSYYITKVILKKIRSLNPEKRYFIFNCTYIDNGWQKLADETNFIPIIENSIDLKKANKDNLKIYYRDKGHYNELGHQIMGYSIARNKQLLDELKTKINK
jgi:lysophospholipase L1-like esterase